MLVISEEFGEWDDSTRRIDLLGIDQDAKLVVIELKRDEDGGHMEPQAIRYAAMVPRMTFQRAIKAYQAFLDKSGAGGDARAAMTEWVRTSEPLTYDAALESRFRRPTFQPIKQVDLVNELLAAFKATES